MIISETKVLPMCELCVRTTENVKTGCHLNVSNIYKPEHNQMDITIEGNQQKINILRTSFNKKIMCKNKKITIKATKTQIPLLMVIEHLENI